MTGRFVRSFVVGAALLIGAGSASAQTPVLAPPALTGNVVTFAWSATAGATGYRLDYGTTPGVYVGNLSVLNVLTFATTAPNGIYFVRVVALPGGEASNEIRLQVPAPPPAPTGLFVARNGTAVAATWTPGTGGGATTGYRLIAGLTSGGSDFTLPTTVNAFGGGPAPANTYYFRVVAFNAVGESAPSNEVVVAMPVGGACDALPLPVTASTFSGYVAVSWPAVPGAAQFSLVATFNGAPGVSLTLPPSTTRVAQVAPLGTYVISVKALLACGSQSPDNPLTVVNDGAAPVGRRTANPAPGTLLPVPGYGPSVVNALASARPDLVAASCKEFGGNNRFMFEVVRELRALDNRWGLNWKRGNAGDVSQDIVSYNRSALPDEGATTGPTGATRNISIFDMIGGHCGPRPGPNWEDVTGVTIERGARAVWTLLPFIQAGYTP